MSLPAVSVVIPVRNAQRSLPTAIQSIRDQTLQDWELILVDDGSRDGTAELLHHFAHADVRIHHEQADGRGIVWALNQGLDRARAPLIARMDADDFAHPDRLRTQIDHLNTQPTIGLVGCRVGFGGDRVRAEGYALHVDWLNTLTEPDEIALNRFVESPLAHPSVTFRKSLIDRHGGYTEGRFPEDYELWLRWLDAGVRMAKVTRTLLTWNDPDERLSRTNPRYDREAFFEIKARYLARTIEATSRGRPVWIWGAGRPTRKRAELLCARGVEIWGYVDVDPAKAGTRIQGRPVIHPVALPLRTEAMVIGYVSNRGARELIRRELTMRGYEEGQDFWMAA
jgi:glycosyltransferase involved in cell wall biosynthesis